MRYMYNYKGYCSVKKGGNSDICYNMGNKLEGIMLNETSQKRKKSTIIAFIWLSQSVKITAERKC
jgi:hypothetical protein